MTSEERAEKKRIEKRISRAQIKLKDAVRLDDRNWISLLLARIRRMEFTLSGYD